jgi:Tfp pilus assembly protein PilO
MEQSIRIQIDHLMGQHRERIESEFKTKHEQLASLTERLRQQLRAVEAQLASGMQRLNNESNFVAPEEI